MRTPSDVSPRTSALSFVALTTAIVLTGCGARSGLVDPVRDAAIDVRDVNVVDARDVVERDAPDGCMPVTDGCTASEVCGNGLDDDCNGGADDGCACDPGAVQPCFSGPPGRRNIGVCRDGTQTCVVNGTAGTWGVCTGGVNPRPDVCNGTDNLCTGCSQQRDCPIACPSPGDVRTPDTVPFASYPLRAGDFYPGRARSAAWEIHGGPCDSLSMVPSFTLAQNGADATFTPRLSGDYTVKLTVITAEGTVLSCEWVVHVEGPGLRVEMCYPENRIVDLDLVLHRPRSTTDWYLPASNATSITGDACSWANCEARIRATADFGLPATRADWGYPRSALSACDNGPQGDQWRALGYCGNPRLDIDNNLSEGIGLPENINVDTPGDGETFRIMVESWTGRNGPTGHPLVNVYCAGRRVATYGAAPDEVQRFTGTPGMSGYGAMWRVADVTTRTAGDGRTSCMVRALHPAGRASGYDVTYDDPRY